MNIGSLSPFQLLAQQQQQQSPQQHLSSRSAASVYQSMSSVSGTAPDLSPYAAYSTGGYDCTGNSTVAAYKAAAVASGSTSATANGFLQSAAAMAAVAAAGLGGTGTPGSGMYYDSTSSAFQKLQQQQQQTAAGGMAAAQAGCGTGMMTSPWSTSGGFDPYQMMDQCESQIRLLYLSCIDCMLFNDESMIINN